MTDWWRSSVWMKIASIMMLVALAMNIIGFATPGWLYVKKGEIHVVQSYFGLWQMCSYSQRIKLCSASSPLLQEQAWFVATQVMACLGLATLVISAILFFLYVFVPRCHGHRGCLFYGILFGWFAGLFLIIAVAIFGVRQDERVAAGEGSASWLFYSFYFVLCSALLCTIAGLFGFREYRKRSYV